MSSPPRSSRRKSFPDLGGLQREVMTIVWKCGEASVKQVRDQLDRPRPPAYTTVLSAMQKLEKAGWLKHRSAGRSYVYLPSRPWEKESRQSLKKLLQSVFQGDRRLLLQQLLDDDKLKPDELEELYKLIRNHRKGVR